MIYRLSLVLGRTFSDLCENLTADEVRGYEAYYALEPWGAQAADIRCAVIAHTTAACMGNGKAKFRDFIPKWDQSTEVLSKSDLRAWAASHQ